MSPTDPSSHREIWDRFIDDLDRAGQSGSAADVAVPAIAGELSAGKRFADLSIAEVRNLARFANTLGRRADVVTVMWQDMQRRINQQRREERKAQKAEAQREAREKDRP